MPVAEQIRSKLSQLPHKPGVYLMKDRFGTVIYVGKARDLRKRVSQYFHPSRRMGWDLKFNELVEAIHDLDIHVVGNEPEAVLLEGKLIKEFHPRYNVSFRDDKRFLLLKVNFNDPIPRFTLTRLKTDDGARYFGPFASSGALRRTLNLVRHKFNLRGCRPLTPSETDYKHCLYAHLKVCTAPCIGNVTREQYLMQALAACDFLDGQSQEMKEQLEAEMKKAAGSQDFEKAAQLRDMLFDLRRTTQKTEKFERLPYKLPVAIDPDRDLAGLAKLGLSHIRIIGLAKEFEEIYRPEEKEPLRLRHDSGALKLLQRVRDESHRFANTYNAQLRLKKISESILDEFPGIGEQRKAALLKKFGSVHRLRLASVQDIAGVPGFGGKAAAELKVFLEARSSLAQASEAQKEKY